MIRSHCGTRILPIENHKSTFANPLMRPLFPDESAPPDERAALEAPGGVRLFTQRWTPDDDPRAVVALVHGYGEHSSRYRHVAAFLRERGYAIHAYDQRGHGRSQGRRAYVDSFGDYTRDLALVLDQVRARRAGGAPLFLMGHSMGGTVSAFYVLREQPDDLAGLVLSSPALAITGARWLRPVAGALSRLWPTLPTSRIDHTKLSRDPAVARHVERDAFMHRGRMPVRTASELMRAVRHVQAQADRLTLPLLCWHGTADAIVPLAGTRRFHERAASSDKTFRRYEDFYHETLNEPERRDVLQDLADWLKRRTADRRRRAAAS